MVPQGPRNERLEASAYLECKIIMDPYLQGLMRDQLSC
jgi:hypothetical protein